jgi:hypothetical protein
VQVPGWNLVRYRVRRGTFTRIPFRNRRLHLLIQWGFGSGGIGESTSVPTCSDAILCCVFGRTSVVTSEAVAPAAWVTSDAFERKTRQSNVENRVLSGGSLTYFRLTHRISSIDFFSSAVLF